MSVRAVKIVEMSAFPESHAHGLKVVRADIFHDGKSLSARIGDWLALDAESPVVHQTGKGKTCDQRCRADPGERGKLLKGLVIECGAAVRVLVGGRIR